MSKTPSILLIAAIILLVSFPVPAAIVNVIFGGWQFLIIGFLFGYGLYLCWD